MSTGPVVMRRCTRSIYSLLREHLAHLDLISIIALTLRLPTLFVALRLPQIRPKDIEGTKVRRATNLWCLKEPDTLKEFRFLPPNSTAKIVYFSYLEFDTNRLLLSGEIPSIFLPSFSLFFSKVFLENIISATTLIYYIVTVIECKVTRGRLASFFLLAFVMFFLLVWKFDFMDVGLT